MTFLCTQCPIAGGTTPGADPGAELSLDWDRSYLAPIEKILPEVQGRNLHTLTLPLGC